MSVRTHAITCAKATDHPGADCTCGARYEPGIEQQLAKAHREIEALTLQFDAAIAQRDRERRSNASLHAALETSRRECERLRGEFNAAIDAAEVEFASYERADVVLARLRELGGS